MMKKSRKMAAALTLAAMMANMMPYNVFAAAADATFTWDFKTGALKEKGSKSTLSVAVNEVDDFASITVDFPAGSFAPTGAVASTFSTNGWVGTVTDADTVTLTKAGNTADAATVEIPVTNPVAATVNAPTVTLDTEAATNGVANVALSDYYTVTVNPTTGIDKQTTSLGVTVKHDGAVVTGALNYVVENGELAPVSISNGNFNGGTLNVPSVTFENTDAALAEYNYTVKITDTSGNAEHDSDATIKVQKEIVNLTGVDNLVYNDNKLVQGTIKNAAGTAYAAAVVTLVDPQGATVSTATTSSTGAFAFNATFNQAGKWTLEVNGAVYKTITVAPKAYTVAVTGTAYANFDNTMTVEVKDGTTAVTGLEPLGANPGTFTVVKADGTTVGTVAVTSAGSGKYTFTNPVGANTAGTYTLKVTRDNGGATDVEYTGTSTYTVATAGNTNVSLTNSTGITGGNEKANLEVVVANAANVGIGVDPVADADAATTAQNTIKKVKVQVTGLGVDKTVESEVAGTKTFAVPAFTPEQAGTLTVTSTVTYWDNSVVTDTKTITVGGYKVTLDLGDVKYGNVVTPKVTVTDAAGVPINNGSVTIASAGGKTPFNVDTDADGTYETGEEAGTISNLANPNNGLYTFKAVKLVDVDNLTVTVKDSGAATKAVFTKAIAGLNTLTVTSTTAKLVGGYNTSINDVTIVPKDEAGNVIQDLTAANFTLNGAAIAGPVVFAPVMDTVELTKEVGYKFTGINPVDVSNKLKDQVFAVSVNSGQKSGSLTIPAVAPAVSFSYADKKVTLGKEEKLTVTVTNPVTNAALNGTLTFAPVMDTQAVPVATSAVTVEDANNAVFQDGTKNAGKNVYDAYITATDGASAAAAQFNVLVNNVVVGTFDVTKATLTSETKELFLGIDNDFTVTLKDAHGAVIADQAITYAGAPLSSTDANGQISLVGFKPMATGSITLAAGALADLKLPIKVPVAVTSLVLVEKDTNGIWATVENTGKGTAKNVKVVVKNDKGAIIGQTTVAELTGGATATVFVKATMTQVVPTKVATKVKQAYKVKTAYKVKVNGKYVTRYKYVTKYRYVTVYKTVNKVVAVKGSVTVGTESKKF